MTRNEAIDKAISAIIKHEPEMGKWGDVVYKLLRMKEIPTAEEKSI